MQKTINDKENIISFTESVQKNVKTPSLVNPANVQRNYNLNTQKDPYKYIPHTRIAYSDHRLEGFLTRLIGKILDSLFPKSGYGVNATFVLPFSTEDYRSYGSNLDYENKARQNINKDFLPKELLKDKKAMQKHFYELPNGTLELRKEINIIYPKKN